MELDKQIEQDIEMIEDDEHKDFMKSCMLRPDMKKAHPDAKKRFEACGIEYKKKKKSSKDSSDGLKSVQRYDLISIDIPDEDNTDFITEKFVETDEGFLSGRAIVTNIGVFPYLQPDGSIRRELRPPEEVLNSESLETLKMKPFTNNHPMIDGGVVTPDNIKKLQTGNLGDRIMYDSFHVSAPLLITDEETIQEVKDGKRALSCGYMADLEMKSGNWLGVAYDAIQRNIRYNHVSLVDSGRAGDKAMIRYDSADGSVAISDEIQTIIFREDDMNLKTVVLDGVEYKAEGDVIKSLNQYKDKAEELQKELKKAKTDSAESKKQIDTITAERDTLKDKVTELEKEVENRVDEKIIDEAVERKLKLLETAKMADVELKGDESEADIQKAVILKAFPNAELEEKSQDYLDARFDGAVEVLEKNKSDEEAEKEEEAEAGSRKLSVDVDGGTPNDPKKKKRTSDDARQDMIDRITKQSHSEEE